MSGQSELARLAIAVAAEVERMVREEHADPDRAWRRFLEMVEAELAARYGRARPGLPPPRMLADDEPIASRKAPRA